MTRLNPLMKSLFGATAFATLGLTVGAVSAHAAPKAIVKVETTKTKTTNSPVLLAKSNTERTKNRDRTESRGSETRASNASSSSRSSNDTTKTRTTTTRTSTGGVKTRNSTSSTRNTPSRQPTTTTRSYSYNNGSSNRDNNTSNSLSNAIRSVISNSRSSSYNRGSSYNNTFYSSRSNWSSPRIASHSFGRYIPTSWSSNFSGFKSSYRSGLGISFSFGTPGYSQYRWAPSTYGLYRSNYGGYSSYTRQTQCSRITVDGLYQGHLTPISVVECYNPWDGHYIVQGTERIEYSHYHH